MSIRIQLKNINILQEDIDLHDAESGNGLMRNQSYERNFLLLPKLTQGQIRAAGTLTDNPDLGYLCGHGSEEHRIHLPSTTPR